MTKTIEPSVQKASDVVIAVNESALRSFKDYDAVHKAAYDAAYDAVHKAAYDAAYKAWKDSESPAIEATEVAFDAKAAARKAAKEAAQDALETVRANLQFD